VISRHSPSRCPSTRSRDRFRPSCVGCRTARPPGAERSQRRARLAQSSLDLELQHRPAVEIDRARFDLWARQVSVDASAQRAAAVDGDVATLEWIRDRIARAFDSVDVTRLDTLLEELRANPNDRDFARAARGAAGLRRLLAHG